MKKLKPGAMTGPERSKPDPQEELGCPAGRQDPGPSRAAHPSAAPRGCGAQGKGPGKQVSRCQETSHHQRPLGQHTDLRTVQNLPLFQALCEEGPLGLGLELLLGCLRESRSLLWPPQIDPCWLPTQSLCIHEASGGWGLPVLLT